MRRLLPILWLAAVPASAAAQALSLRPPSLGEAVDQIERLLADRPQVAQTFVVPERPGQNPVSWYEFRWHHHDVAPPGGGKGGIRLYYYESAREVAERALPAIESAYARLAEQFHYSPTQVIPYILYSSKREFQTTNVFEVSESVLGVTSPKDLKMTLPYFGDHEKFKEVSTHEMVHQFTVQKLLDIAGAQDMGSMVDHLPLWFVEGIAEYYSKGGIDPETDAFLRDLVWNPDPEHHYQIIPFAEDRIRGYIPTYKLGQARVAFIADAYGKERIQSFIENAYLMGASVGGTAERGFGALVRRVLGESLEQVDGRWRSWLKRRYYAEYLRTRQDLGQVQQVQGVSDEIESYVASPDGNVLLARVIDREQGRAALYLVDPRYPKAALQVVSDNEPGIESLHPIEENILAISDKLLAFAAQDGPTDSLYVQAWRRETAPGKPAKLQLGKRHKIVVSHPKGEHFIEITDPTFSPDSSHLAFVGLTERGRRDIYVVEVRGGTAQQVTDDAYAERDLDWGRDGIYCSSDSTEHGRFNVFRVDPLTGARTRLTTEAVDDRYPRPQPDGSVLYSSWRGGKSDLYLLDKGKFRRLTDFATGLSNPGVAPGVRGIFAQTFYRGRFRVVEVPRVAWLQDPPVAVAPAAGPPLPVPAEPIPPASPAYNAYALSNWRPEAGVIFGGGASNAIAGRAAVLFADMLRDRTFYLDLAVYGSFDYTQGLAVFENRSGRFPWALGFYHYVQVQLDRLEPSLEYYQRDFGVTGLVRYPLDRFRRLDVELTVGALHRYCLTDTNSYLVLICQGVDLSTAKYASTVDWERRNGGMNPFLGPAVRFGYDTIRYDQYTGPIDGSSLLLEGGGYWLPERRALNGFFRADASSYWRIAGRANFMVRMALGSSFAPDETGKLWSRSWWLSAADNLRGFYPYDLGWLVGQNYYVANAELQFPLEPLIRLLFFDYLEGVLALDFGGVFNRWSTLRDPTTGTLIEPGPWEARTLTGVLGINILLGPILLRLHFGHPFDIGGQPTPALLNKDSWVTNLTLRYFFF